MEWDENRAKLGIRIQKIRKAKGETQEQLAEALGIDRQVIKTWETATRRIKAQDLISLADHFDCTIDFLVGRNDNPSRDKNLQEICNYTGLSQWSIEELHNCKNDLERKSYIETINAVLENPELFHEIAFNVTRAAEARTMWRLTLDKGINVRDPEIWNEANRVLSIRNIATQENSPYNLLELQDSAGIPVLLPTGSWFLTGHDAAEFLVDRATVAFRDAINEHIEKWNAWPDLNFAPGADGTTQVTINPNSKDNTDANQEGEHE